MTILQALLPLAGRWRGSGQGRFSTIAPFQFEDSWEIGFESAYPLFRYEQRTVLTPSGQPSHWELGFIREREGQIEFSNAQDGGRVEVLVGRIEAQQAGRLTLRLASDSFGNDARLIRTERLFELDGDELRYWISMTTTTSAAPVQERHIESRLRRWDRSQLGA